MPCHDSGPDYAEQRSLQARNDKLARVNCKIFEFLESLDDGTAESLILKDEEVAAWWREHKEFDRKRKAAEARARRAAEEETRLERIRIETMAQLTAEQIKALGIKIK